MTRDVFDEIKEQEARLGLPADFYVSLINEDDWSFVIKLNALVEAACTHALAARLHAPELIESLASLDLGHSKHGKVALLRALDAMTSEQASVLQLLYQLRNSLAHNIAQVGFSFRSYIAGLDKQQLTNFLKRAGHGVQDTVSLEGKTVSRAAFVVQNPKFALWLTVAGIIACLHLEHEIAELRLDRLGLELARGGNRG